MKEQKINTSIGCPYSCSFCFNGKEKFKELSLPKIKYNKVIIYDAAFLSRKNILNDIKELGSKKINNRIVYYEILQGINLKDLTPEIAKELKKNHFINIRFAWDNSYTKKSFYRVYDGIKNLLNAGYKNKDLICYILCNYFVSLRECLYKSKVLLYYNIPVCCCIYRQKYQDPQIYYHYWNKKEVDYFKQECRINNQIIRFNGYDPEIEKRLIHAVKIPNEKNNN